MKFQEEEYKGRRIELRQREVNELRRAPGERPAEAELLIDGQPVPYMRLPDGSYALHEYAYDWRTDLIDLARRFIDYKDKTDNIRRQRKEQ